LGAYNEYMVYIRQSNDEVLSYNWRYGSSEVKNEDDSGNDSTRLFLKLVSGKHLKNCY
jgi:hypothetical protein